MWLLVCFIVVMMTLAKAAILAQSDFEALLDIKKGLFKDPSGKVMISWDPESLANDACPSSWYGISCSAGRVTSIRLDDLGLEGDFSFTTLRFLTTLSNLSISNNHLTGSIVDITSLESLQVLDLSRNLFHGSLPDDLAGLKNLRVINLSFNNFEGKLPSSFGRFQHLEYLDFMANAFVGDVMLLLSHLGPTKYVDLSSNRLTGSLDLALGNSSFVSTIKYFNVSGNKMTGELFPHDGMPFFDSLEVFDASNNHFTGNVPSFNFVVSLRVLRLGRNQLSGSLPEAILLESSLVLSEIDLSHNQLEGPVESITSSTLKYLNLSSNKLSGFLPAKVGHCAIIDLSNNELSGNLSRMQSWGNYVEVIDLSSNFLRGTMPNETSQFLRLSSLKIFNNSLGGVLSPMLSIYPELKVIDLSLNQLSGALPLSLFTSAKLEDLNLSGNKFSGSLLIPATPDGLVSLDLSANLFEGNIPSGLNKFRNLIYLNLSRNQFIGAIPADLPDYLERLDLTYNDLNGSIPQNLWRFLDSSFHPGNSHLMTPFPHSSPRDIPGIDRRRKSHLKSVIKASLIAGAASVALFTSIFSIVIIYRSKCRTFVSNDTHKEVKGIDQGNIQTLGRSSLPKDADLTVSSPNLSPRVPLPSQLMPLSDNASKLVAEQACQISDHPLPKNKDDRIVSSVSLLSFPKASPRIQYGQENSGVLKATSPDNLLGDLQLFDSSLIFTAEELSCAAAEVVEKSCHGTLCRAALASGHVLAVKWLREGIVKSKKEFVREAKKLGNIRHPNLVSLQGYYWGPNEHERMLISCFVNAPCLANCLQETELRCTQLSLDHRLKISVDIGRCLSYLHNEIVIPHGNLKATNILLEVTNFTALLTDYSLHRIMTPSGTAEQIFNSATMGYIPPEFLSSSEPSPSLKSDVYAYGIILLELVTGKCSGQGSSNPNSLDLPVWISTLARENRISESFDKFLITEHCPEQTIKVLEGLLAVAMRCVLPASERPDIRSIFEDIFPLVSLI